MSIDGRDAYNSIFIYLDMYNTCTAQENEINIIKIYK